MYKTIILLLITCTLLSCLIGCDSRTNDSDDGDDDDNDDSNADDDDDDDTAATNQAKVFSINPVATPDLIDVELGNVAGDLDGELTSAKNSDDIRLLRVFTCLDEGETNQAMGVTQRICTLRQRANKMANGDYIYEDWENAANGVFDVEDIHAEVSLYYHAQKIYSFITSDEVGVMEYLPGRHEVNGEPVPINLVANYRSPVPVSSNELQPFPMSFYSPNEYTEVGMAAINGLEGVPGDFLVFGQGPQADFAYDGENVYHEFGHLINYATAKLEHNIYPDQYGMTNVANALEQGLAETFVFLVSGKTALFDYIDQVSQSGGFMRHVDNEDRFPDSMEGFDQFDGMALAGANYDAYQYLKEEAGMTEARFTRILLYTLLDLFHPEGKNTFSQYANLFLAKMEQEDLAEYTDGVRASFEAHGLFQTVRAKDATGYVSADFHTQYIGGTYPAMWNSYMTLLIEEVETPAYPACVQMYVDLPAGKDTLTISATAVEMHDGMGMYPDPDDWDYKLFRKAGEVILYQETEKDLFEMDADAIHDPILSSKDGKSIGLQWTISGLESGSRQYVQFVNLGTSQGVLIQIEISFE